MINLSHLQFVYLHLLTPIDFDFLHVIAFWNSVFLGVGILLYLTVKMNRNVNDLENSTREYKVFDPRKAKAQIDVYKEIYSIMDKEDEGKLLSQ